MADPHIKALQLALDQAFKQAGVQVIGRDQELSNGWIVVDAFDIMLHLQTEEMRDYYQIDQLWKDAATVELSAIVA